MTGREGEGEEELLHLLLERMYLTVVNVVNEENEGVGGDTKEGKWTEMRHSFSSFGFFGGFAVISLYLGTAVIQSFYIHMYSRIRPCGRGQLSSRNKMFCLLDAVAHLSSSIQSIPHTSTSVIRQSCTAPRVIYHCML